MRLLAIGYPLPNASVDNYNPLTAPAYFDYDAIYIDPTIVTDVARRLVDDGESFEAHDGRMVVNAATTATAVSAADLFRRRLEETERLLQMGGTVIVAARPNATQSGIIGFEGLDRYSWLPAPAGTSWGPPFLRAAEGKTIRILADEHPIAHALREHRKDLRYRAYFDDRQAPFRQAAKPVAAGGSGAPIAVEFAVLGGKVLFVPVFPEQTGSFRTQVATRIVDAARQMGSTSDRETPPHWAGSLAVPGLEQVEAEVEEAAAALSDTEARVQAARERQETLGAYRRLFTDDGRTFATVVRDALTLLGFGVEPGDPAQGLVATSEETTAFVETEGSREEVVEWPYVRLQRRLERELIDNGTQPKGIVIVNGHRHQQPDERPPQFAQTLRIACENYRYALLTSATLFELVKRALGGASEADLTGVRRRMLATSGLLDLEEALGEAVEPRESGPIF